MTPHIQQLEKDLALAKKALEPQTTETLEDTEGKLVVRLGSGTIRTDLRTEGDTEAVKHVGRLRREGESVGGLEGPQVYLEAMGGGRLTRGRRR